MSEYHQKLGAVEQWHDALEELPDDRKWANNLRSADIHDSRGRVEIEEEIEYAVPEEYYLPLHDAFDDLCSTFDW